MEHSAHLGCFPGGYRLSGSHLQICLSAANADQRSAVPNPQLAPGNRTANRRLAQRTATAVPKCRSAIGGPQSTTGSREKDHQSPIGSADGDCRPKMPISDRRSPIHSRPPEIGPPIADWLSGRRLPSQNADQRLAVPNPQPAPEKRTANRRLAQRTATAAPKCQSAIGGPPNPSLNFVAPY